MYTVLKVSKRLISVQSAIPKICIVGGGPAGFYAAQHLVKNVPNANVDIFERLPVPFGLVRYGVAPDHPDVKNVIHTFTKIALHSNVRFIGNVNLGSTISLQDLQEAYHAILLTYGAEEDRTLNIPGENLSNVISARQIVGWYNGVPWDANLKIDLSGDIAVIIGQGNVAIDVARILLTPVDLLKNTDITQHALEALVNSKIRQVYLLGRRGPLQAAFTIKELREMLKLPNCSTKWCQKDFVEIPAVVSGLARPRKRLTELMLKSINENKNINHDREFIPKFFRSPLKFEGNKKVTHILLGVNKLIGDDLLLKSAFLTDKTEELECDLAVRSVGYKSIKVDKQIPFDMKRGVIINQKGKVTNGLYTAGWLGTGPSGVILNTMSHSFDIANIICNDLRDILKNNLKPGYDKVQEILKKSNTPVVTWEGWEKIDQYEQEMGKKVGKPREKILSIEKMLEIGAEPCKN